MKRLINMLLSMVYPALISFFIFSYASVESSNLGRDYREPIQAISATFAIIFGVAFVAGVVWNIIYSLKHKDE